MVFGDSTVARQNITILSGLPVLNAGVGSTKAADIAELTPEIIRRAQPLRIIVAISANDFILDRITPLNEWKQTVAAYPNATFVGITPNGSPIVPQADQFLASLGSYVPPIPMSLTTDGIHLSRTGAEEWQRRRPC